MSNTSDWQDYVWLENREPSAKGTYSIGSIFKVVGELMLASAAVGPVGFGMSLNTALVLVESFLGPYIFGTIMQAGVRHGMIDYCENRYENPFRSFVAQLDPRKIRIDFRLS